MLLVETQNDFPQKGNTVNCMKQYRLENLYIKNISDSDIWQGKWNEQ